MKIDQPIINRFLLYFFKGLLLIAPLGATLYLITFILHKIDSLASFGIPGLGMLIVVVSITLLGYIGSTLLVKTTFEFTEALIKKLPLISLLYSSLKDFTSAFVSGKKKFDKPILVLTNKETKVYRIGFITRASLEVLAMPNHVAVYLPNSYDFAGIILIVPSELVQPLDLPSSEVMKFIFSGAVTPLEHTITPPHTTTLEEVAKEDSSC